MPGMIPGRASAVADRRERMPEREFRKRKRLVRKLRHRCASPQQWAKDSKQPAPAPKQRDSYIRQMHSETMTTYIFPQCTICTADPSRDAAYQSRVAEFKGKRDNGARYPPGSIASEQCFKIKGQICGCAAPLGLGICFFALAAQLALWAKFCRRSATLLIWKTNAMAGRVLIG